MAERDFDEGRLVGRVFRRDGALEDIGRRLDPRILEHLALRRGMQKVGIDREGGFAALVPGHRNLVLLGEVDQVGPRLELPFAPWRDHLDRRIEGVGGQLESDLVVAFAGRTVGDGVGAGLVGDLDEALGDQRAGNRRSEEVDPLIDRVHPHHREDEVADEFLAKVLDVDLLDPHQFRLLAGRLQLLALSEIGGEGDDLGAVGGLKPLEDDRGV